MVFPTSRKMIDTQNGWMIPHFRLRFFLVPRTRLWIKAKRKRRRKRIRSLGLKLFHCQRRQSFIWKSHVRHHNSPLWVQPLSPVGFLFMSHDDKSDKMVMKAGLDKRWTHSNHSTDFCLHCFYHLDQPINSKSWSLPRSGLKRTADGAVLAQSSLESQRSELEGEVETGIPFDFKRKSWSSEKIYDIFPRHDFNILVNHPEIEMCKCQHEYFANECRFSLQSDEAKNIKQQEPHEKVREVFNLSNSSLQKSLPPGVLLGNQKEKWWSWSKTALQVASRSPKRKTPCWRDTSALGGKIVVGMKSEIHDLFLLGCVCVFFSLESKVVGFFFGVGLRYGKMWVFWDTPQKKSGYSQEEVNEVFEIQE